MNDIEHKITELQQLQQQISINSAQIESMTMRKKELEEASKELESLKEGETVYRSVGELMIKTSNDEKLQSSLKEEAEVIEIRLKSMNKQQEAMFSKYESLQKEVATLAGMARAGKN